MTRRGLLREMLCGALVALALAQVLQLPATAVGSMMFLSGELTFAHLGRSDPALAGTAAAQRIEMRGPSVAGRERWSVYVALRSLDASEIVLGPTSALNRNVIDAVSRVPIGLVDRTSWRSSATVDERRCRTYPGIDAQLRYRIVLPRTSALQRMPPGGPSLFAFQQAGEEWIVERSCLDAD